MEHLWIYRCCGLVQSTEDTGHRCSASDGLCENSAVQETSPTPIANFLLDEFVPRKGLITRYRRKMLEDGAKYYSKITTDNFK